MHLIFAFSFCSCIFSRVKEELFWEFAFWIASFIAIRFASWLFFIFKISLFFSFIFIGLLLLSFSLFAWPFIFCHCSSILFLISLFSILFKNLFASFKLFFSLKKSVFSLKNK